VTLRGILQTRGTRSKDTCDKAHIQMLLRVHNRPGMPNPVKFDRGSGRYWTNWNLRARQEITAPSGRGSVTLRPHTEPRPEGAVATNWHSYFLTSTKRKLDTGPPNRGLTPARMEGGEKR